MSVVAASASESKALHGQQHRSGFNFRLLHSNGSGFTLSCPVGVVFNIMQDKVGSDPVIVKNATDGTKIGGEILKINTDYYLADPQHTDQSFAVTITQTT